MSGHTLTLTDVGVTRGGRRLLDGVSLSVAPGELVVVVGPNGAGKSTLIRCILGAMALDGGQIQVGGVPVMALSGPERAQRLGWLPQRASLAEPVPVLEPVMAARFRLRETRYERRRAAQRALDTVGLGDLAARDATTLSGGESQRVGLAALIAQQADIWLLDEPANHLDPAVQGHVLDLVLGAWQQGRTVVMVTHDPDRVLSRIDPHMEGVTRVLGLRDGRVQFDCALDTPDLARHLAQVYDVHVDAVQVGGRRRFLFSVTA